MPDTLEEFRYKRQQCTNFEAALTLIDEMLVGGEKEEERVKEVYRVILGVKVENARQAQEINRLRSILKVCVEAINEAYKRPESGALVRVWNWLKKEQKMKNRKVLGSEVR